jgi:anti-sigma regulatory factor (Ser/Thr protein kinase)
MVAMRHGYPASAASVPAARNAAAGCVRRLGVEESVARAVELAVTEACSNVVLHAYRERGEPGTMVVLVEQADDLCITVFDYGLGMLPRDDSPGLGMGLPLITHFSDDLELLSTRGGGSAVRIHFQVPPQRDPQQRAA